MYENEPRLYEDVLACVTAQVTVRIRRLQVGFEKVHHLSKQVTGEARIVSEGLPVRALECTLAEGVVVYHDGVVTNRLSEIVLKPRIFVVRGVARLSYQDLTMRRDLEAALIMMTMVKPGTNANGDKRGSVVPVAAESSTAAFRKHSR